MNKNERLIVGLLASINFTHILDFMIMMPLGNYLMPYFKISPQQFSFLVSAYTISAALSGFLAAFFVNNYDRKKVLLIAYTGFLIGTIACGIAPNFILLFSARVFAGLFGGLIGAQVISIVADVFPYEKRGMAMGTVMSSFALASTFGVPFALYLANLISWHAPFLFVGIVGVVLIPLIKKYLPPMNEHLNHAVQHERKWEILMEVLKDKNQYSALIFSGLVMFGHFLIIPFINPFMEFNVGFSKNFTPLIYLFGGVASFFASNIIGRIADIHGKLNIFTICVLIALPLVLVLTNLTHIHPAIVLTLFSLWFVVATGRGVTAGALVSNVVPSEQRGSFQSFNSSLQQLGSGLASMTAGLIVVRNPTSGKIEYYDYVGYLSIAVLLFCTFLARRIFKTMDKKVAVSI